MDFDPRLLPPHASASVASAAGPSSSAGRGSKASTNHADEPVAVSLASLAVGEFATIHAVLGTDDTTDADLVMRLIEIGFVPGERVRVVAIGRPGGQPIAVRLAAADSGRRAINGATFALRRHEADFIRVVPDRTTGGGS